MLPPPTSQPSITMSYAFARTLPGSVSSRSQSSSMADVNGWCMAVQRCSSALHSSSGNSTTQHSACTSFRARPSRRPSSTRSSPRPWPRPSGSASATISARSPVLAPSRSASAARSASLRNLAADDFAPSSRYAMFTRPLAPGPLGHLGQVVELLAAVAGAPGRDDALDLAAAGDRAARTRRSRCPPPGRSGRRAPSRSAGRACPSRTCPSPRRRSARGTASAGSASCRAVSMICV